MSTLSDSLRDYLTLRRGLGHQMADAARLLPSLVSFLEPRGLGMVTVRAALDWCRQPAPIGGSTVAPRRMTATRGFARYLSGRRPRTRWPG